LVNTIIRVRHLGYILIKLVTSHESYVCSIYVVRDVVVRV